MNVAIPSMDSTRKVLLASASPARRSTLVSAGITPLVEVADLDEDALLESLSTDHPQVTPAEQVQALATAKAQSVLRSVDARRRSGAPVPEVLIACDSMFEFDGDVVGKPHTSEVAFERLTRMAGRSGTLWTGHCLVDIPTGHIYEGVSSAIIHVAPMSPNEIRAYISTGEPLEVAGSFTIDGLGGPFIERIEGDHHGVVGLSLPVFRNLLEQAGRHVFELWDDDAGRPRLPVPGDHPRGDGDGFVECGCGSRHWGRNGGAGLLLWRVSPSGSLQVLVQLRASWSHMAGRWSTPGGAIGMTETPVVGGLREFSEETGISPEDIIIDGSWTAAHPDWQYVNFAGHIRDHRSLELQPNSESEQLAWIDLVLVDDLELLPAFRGALEHLTPIIRDAYTVHRNNADKL